MGDGEWARGAPASRSAHPAAHARAVAEHRRMLLADPGLVCAARRRLKGKRLGCRCGRSVCHADSLAEVANCSDMHLESLVREERERAAQCD